MTGRTERGQVHLSNGPVPLTLPTGQHRYDQNAVFGDNSNTFISSVIAQCGGTANFPRSAIGAIRFPMTAEEAERRARESEF